jgi:hypothetical protein
MFNFPATLRGPSGFAYPYKIDNSCMFDSASTSYLTVPGTHPVADASNITVSYWLKRTKLGALSCPISGYYNTSNWADIRFNADDTITFQNYYSATNNGVATTSQVFRDCSGWYHFVFRWDLGGATNADKLQLWCNGVNLEWSITDSPANHCNLLPWTAPYFGIGSSLKYGYYFDGYVADVVIIDGTTEDATDFGEFKNGIWVPKNPTGLTFGTAGAYYEFWDSSNLGDDTSGNTNDLTTQNNISTDHQFTDTPTSNYPTIDANNQGVGNTYLKEGGLIVSWPNSNWRGAGSSILLPKTGKWYWEVKLVGSDVDGFQFGFSGQDKTSGVQCTSAFSLTGSVEPAMAWVME